MRAMLDLALLSLHRPGVVATRSAASVSIPCLQYCQHFAGLIGIPPDWLVLTIGGGVDTKWCALGLGAAAPNAAV